jgi:hypothetical protein
METMLRREWLAAATASALTGCAGFTFMGGRKPRFGGELALLPAELEAIRRRTVVLTLDERDRSKLEEFKAAVAQAWTYSPIEAVLPDQLKNYSDTSKYMYFAIDTETTSTRDFSFNATYFHASLVLVDTLDDERRDPNGFCRYPLSTVMPNKPRWFRRKEKEEPLQFHNWNVPMLSLYLRSIQLDLEASLRHGYYESFEYANKLAPLRDHTLYVPSHCLNTADLQYQLEPLEAAEVFEDYPYAYKVVSPEELAPLVSAALADPKRDLFVLDCVVSSGEKFVSVITPRDGRIYKHYNPMKYQLKEKDLARLVKMFT